jgi:hypothetical protein
MDVNSVYSKATQKIVPTPQPHLLLWSPLDLIVLASVQHEFVGVSWRHAAVTFGPVIRDGVCKDRAISIERSGTDRPRGSFES